MNHDIFFGLTMGLLAGMLFMGVASPPVEAGRRVRERAMLEHAIQTDTVNSYSCALVALHDDRIKSQYWFDQCMKEAGPDHRFGQPDA